MKRIKILYLIDQLNIGGTEKQLLAVLERLDRSRFDPYLACLRPSQYFEECKIDCHKQILNVTSLASWDGLKKLYSFSRYLRQEKMDIVQTFFFDSTAFGVLAARLAGVKQVLSSRRDMGFWYTRKILAVLFFINLLTHRIVVNSEAIKQNVHKKENVSLKKIDVIYNGIDLEPFAVTYDIAKLRRELGISDKDQIVGIVANLNRRVKRVDLFIDAAVEVLKKQPDTSFVIVGDGCFRSELETQAGELGIANKICFVGSQENVVPYLQLFDIGVLTSESEGFANSIVEYMASGLPVVCFDTGGNCELIENTVNGYTVYIQDTNAIADKIVSVNNKYIRRNMKKKNTTKVEFMCWKSTIKKVEAFYCRLQV